MKLNGQILRSLAAILFFVAAPSIFGQAAQQPEPGSPVPQQRQLDGDPIRQLNLSPEQLEQIRTIRQHNQKERAAIGARVRETNRVLETVLDADSPDEPLVEQRMREASAAQAEAMRMRILTEVRIRKVLTAEQRSLLRTLRQQTNQLRRERPLRLPAEALRPRAQQNQRNGIAPLLPRRNALRRTRPLNQQ